MGFGNGRVVVLRPDQHVLGWLAETDSTNDLVDLLSSHVGNDVFSNDSEIT